MITAEHLVKTYGERRAVDDVSFTVEPGEIFGLLGPNGAGKTTTIRMLVGLCWPTAGTARVDGLDPFASARDVHRRIGVVGETPNLYERLTVRYNLDLFRRLLSVDAAGMDAVLDRLDLREVLGQRAGTLSKGWRQRVLIARALLHDPQVLFLDEPTAGLDPNSARMMRRLLADLRDDGHTIVLCTHDMAEADALCDRVGVMFRGRLVALDAPRELTSTEDRQVVVEHASGGGTEETRLPLRDPGTPDAVRDLLATGAVRSIRTETRTLADVFATLTGGELS